MSQFGYLVELDGLTFDEGATWIHALPLGKFTHPVYGEIDITPDRVQRLADSVKNKVRETDLDIDYDHKQLTTEAAGWVKDADVRPNGLWLLVDWTNKARQFLKDRAYRYFSAEFKDEWEHPKTKQKYKDVLFGGGLTNRPFLKDILPINLSEVVDSSHGHAVIINNEGGNVVDPKKLRKALGLPDDATDEQVDAKLTELSTPKEPDKPATKEPVAANDGNDLATKLKELSPDLAASFQTLLDQNKALSDTVVNLEAATRLAEVNVKLGELSKGKQYALAPAVADKVRQAALNTPRELSDKLLDVLGEVVNGGLVELGEKGATGGERQTGTGSTFMEKVDAYVKANEGVAYADAVRQVSIDEPQLYNEYRDSVYITEGAK